MHDLSNSRKFRAHIQLEDKYSHKGELVIYKEPIPILATYLIFYSY
jgi:hypothetical protein